MTSTMRAPLLIVTPSIHAAIQGETLFLDEKAATGLLEYARLWPGPVRAIFPEGPAKIGLFAREYRIADLPWQPLITPRGAAITDALLADGAVIMASGDSHTDFPLADQAKVLKIPLTFIIEYTLRTRLQIAASDRRSWPRRLRTIVWTLNSERKRRRAFRTAGSIQSNGAPCAVAYKDIVPDILRFFDTRLSQAAIATDAQIAAKAERLRAGAPLRLAFTGRLEPMKGAHHLIPTARALIAADVPFQLDIYGAGSLGTELAAALATDPVLKERVHLHAPIDFATQLVPWLREEVDLFLCCHVQGDPSCTYLETLGCGVPILGFGNEAWAGILALRTVGWQAAVGDHAALARLVSMLHQDRSALTATAYAARDFGREHSFEPTMAARIAHLKRIAGIRVTALPA